MKHRGRSTLIGATLVMWSLIAGLFMTYGYQQTWRLWKVPTLLPVFFDLRLIPGSAESFARGYEPSIENPYDPIGRVFNYPAVWRLFFYSGIRQQDSIWIGISMIVLFFAGVLLFPGRLSVRAAVAMLLVIFSPALMFLYERGNVDLIVFFLCVLIVLAAGYSAWLTTALLIAGGIIKLFPTLGLTVLLKETPRTFWLCAVTCVVALSVYVVGTLDSVHGAWTLTQRGNHLSYGTDVFVTRYGYAVSAVLSRWLSADQGRLLLAHGPRTTALILLAAVALRALRTRIPLGMIDERNLAAFRMGASIYVGTFLLGNNWDYRLAFLVLVVPQIVEWLQAPHKTVRLVAALTMAMILVACWHLWLASLSVGILVEDSERFWFVLDELSNWVLFVGLGYLLAESVALSPVVMTGSERENHHAYSAN